MSTRVIVCYGQPDDPEAFDKYYETVHIPLASKLPGLLDYTWGKCAGLGDDAPYYGVAQLEFESPEALQAALGSAEMQAAAADVPNFASGGATLFTAEQSSVLT
ncbi:EthD family reductase [Gordonia sp. NPDC003424]